MEHEPSQSHRKEPLRPGWVHPIGVDRVLGLLLDRGVRVHRLVLTMPAPEDRPLLLIRVRRFSDLSLEGKRALQDRDRSTLDPVTLRISALPHDQLASGRDASAGALHGALQWIADARARGNAWQATERLWTAHFVDGAVVVTEHQRQSRGAYLGFTGLEDH